MTTDLVNFTFPFTCPRSKLDLVNIPALDKVWGVKLVVSQAGDRDHFSSSVANCSTSLMCSVPSCTGTRCVYGLSLVTMNNESLSIHLILGMVSLASTYPV